jgi:glycine/sarcosine N-methyltransferase
MPHLLHARPGGPPETDTDYAGQYSEAFVSRWDELIDWDKRAAGEGGFFTDLLLGVGVSSVLDVATGSGFHAVQLKKAGFRVSASDGSQTMIDRAKLNFARHGVKIPIARCDWLDLDPAQVGTFDAVLCLGSSLCHVFDEQGRLAVLRRFESLLRPGGVLVVDQRNFQAILAGHFASSGRFYYCSQTAQVTLGEVNEQVCEFVYTFSDEDTHRLRVAPLRPDQLRREILHSGFSGVRSFGDFKWIYDPMRVDFIIHVARRAGLDVRPGGRPA